MPKGAAVLTAGTMTESASKHSFLMSFIGRSWGLLAAILLARTTSASACGLDWQVPSNHFEGVNEFGEFSYWRDLGGIDLGGDLKVPLVIGFRPTRGFNSCLGRGWILPLLESNIVQLDDKRFLLTQPDGISRQFWRSDSTSSILQGQGNWKGEIGGDTIHLWAECGWKLVFEKGKIASITTPKNRTLSVAYFNGRATGLSEGGKTLLTIEFASDGSHAAALICGGTRFGITSGTRPKVEAVDGKNLIAGLEHSVLGIALANSGSANFDFAVDDKQRPTMTIPGDSPKVFTWDPKTGRLLSDGRWNYDIKQGQDIWQNAGIGRTDAGKQREFWFDDKVNGTETTIRADGVTTVVTRFARGALTGKIRSIKETKSGKTRILESYSYDEAGNVCGYQGLDGDYRIVNDVEKRIRSAVGKDGKWIWKEHSDSRGFTYLKEYQTGKVEKRRLLSDGVLEKVFLTPNGGRTEISMKGGEVIKFAILDKAGNIACDLIAAAKNKYSGTNINKEQIK